MSGPDGYLTKKCSKKCIKKWGVESAGAPLRMISRDGLFHFGAYVNSLLCPSLVTCNLFHLGCWSSLTVKLRPIALIDFSNIFPLLCLWHLIKAYLSLSMLNFFPVSILPCFVFPLSWYTLSLYLNDEFLTRLQRITQMIIIH